MSSSNDSIAYHEGGWKPLRDCRVRIDTHALQYGTAVFEGIRGYWDGERVNILFLREHNERLRQNAKLLLMQPPVLDELCDIMIELVRRNQMRQNCYLRPMCYLSSDHLSPQLHDEPHAFFCYLLPLDDYLDTSKGLELCVSSWRRLSDNAMPTRIKASGSYLNSALAKSEAVLNGYDEAIFLNEAGEVSEGSAENIFIVRDGVLITPPKTAGILEGLTRRAIIALAGELDLPVEERAVGRSELYRADECFLVGTGCQVSWVRSIDRRSLGDGCRGAITGRLQERYEQAVYGRDPAYASWLTPVD